jgi:hypothetical protein
VAPVLDTSTPGLEAFGTAGAACSCGHPQSPDLQAATRKAERRLQRWYVDATNAVQDARSQMGRAGDRFAEFAGGGVKSLKAATGTAGGIASILFGTPGRAAGVLANVIVDAAAASPSGGIRAGLARRLDDQKDAADAAVQRRYDGLTASMERVAGTPEAGAFEASIDHVRICRVPGENALYRDLLLKFADDKRMKLDGGWTCELHYQKYYQSWNSSVPFWMDGQEVADELNRMVQIEPSIRKPFRSNERP